MCSSYSLVGGVSPTNWHIFISNRPNVEPQTRQLDAKTHSITAQSTGRNILVVAIYTQLRLNQPEYLHLFQGHPPDETCCARRSVRDVCLRAVHLLSDCSHYVRYNECSTNFSEAPNLDSLTPLPQETLSGDKITCKLI